MQVMKLKDNQEPPNIACTDEVGSQGSHIKEINQSAGERKNSKHLHTTFTALCKSVDKGCIILMSAEPAKPHRGSP